MFAKKESDQNYLFSKAKSEIVCNVEIERYIIGYFLSEGHGLDRLRFESFDIREEYFYITQHQKIFSLIRKIILEGKTLDLMIFLSYIEVCGVSEELGGREAIIQIVDDYRYSYESSIDYCIELLKEKYIRRELIKFGMSLRALSCSEQKLDEIYCEVQTGLSKISHQVIRGRSESIASCLTSFFVSLERESFSKLTEIKTGFYDLDHLLQGLIPGDLILIAGRPSMGKTAFSLDIMKNVALSGKTVLFFSLEMSKEQVAQRLLSNESKIPLSFLRSGKILSSQWSVLSHACYRLSEMKIYIEDSFNYDLNKMYSVCRRLKLEEDLSLIVIDYLQLISSSGESNRVYELARISRYLKFMARSLGVPVVALSQLSRGVENRTDKRPLLSDLRDSGALEQDADVVLMLYRDEYYHPNTVDKGICEVIVSKNRCGPVGSVKLLFNSEIVRFENLATDY